MKRNLLSFLLFTIATTFAGSRAASLACAGGEMLLGAGGTYKAQPVNIV